MQHYSHIEILVGRVQVESHLAYLLNWSVWTELLSLLTLPTSQYDLR